MQPGDRIGLVGRNGAGKTTTLKVLAGEGAPYAGAVERRGPVGYLPQDPRTGDLDLTARDRVLSARGLDTHPGRDEEPRGRDGRATRRQGDPPLRRLEDQFAGLGGYAAEAEAARICANLGLPDRVLAQTIGTLSGGQRRRIELARILFADAGETGGGTLLLDEPTNHLDADSITWLRGFLGSHKGGLIVISHDVSLLDAVVNKVWYLDANRSIVDVVQPRLEGVPGAARDRRAAPPPRAGQRREEGRRADGPGRQDAGQGHQDRRRPEHGPAGREDALRPGGGPGLRQGGQGALPDPGLRAARPR